MDRDPDRAAVLIPAVGGVSTAVSAHGSGVGWVLVTNRDDLLDDAIVALVGAHPWGPIRGRVLFGSRTTAGRVDYLPLAHPELPLQDGSLVPCARGASWLQGPASPAMTAPALRRPTTGPRRPGRWRGSCGLVPTCRAARWGG